MACHRWHLLLLGWGFHLPVGVCRGSIARPILVLRICAISLIRIRPLVFVLVFEHCLNILSHGLSQLAIGVQRCRVSSLHFCVLVIYIHTASAREIPVAEYHAFKSAIILLLLALFSSHFIEVNNYYIQK